MPAPQFSAPPALQGLGLSGVDLYFALARGAEGAPACDMSKLFDTNYHFLAPELTADSGARAGAPGRGCLQHSAVCTIGAASLRCLSGSARHWVQHQQHAAREPGQQARFPLPTQDVQAPRPPLTLCLLRPAPLLQSRVPTGRCCWTAWRGARRPWAANVPCPWLSVSSMRGRGHCKLLVFASAVTTCGLLRQCRFVLACGVTVLSGYTPRLVPPGTAGPVTLACLARGDFDRSAMVARLAPAYAALLRQLAQRGVPEVQVWALARGGAGLLAADCWFPWATGSVGWGRGVGGRGK